MAQIVMQTRDFTVDAIIKNIIEEVRVEKTGSENSFEFHSDSTVEAATIREEYNDVERTGLIYNYLIGLLCIYTNIRSIFIEG